VLALLDKIPGVERSFANHTGTMVRVSVAGSADPEKIAEQVARVLTEGKRNPTRLTGEEVKEALGKQQWREGERVGELSAIEFRTLGLRQVQTFAEKEKLDKATIDKLVKIAGEEWDRLVDESAPEDPKQSGKIDWKARCRKFDLAVVERARSVLMPDQVERLKESFGLPREARPKE
jgi:hypothetical protein